jgi:hypothetical protein
MVDPVERRSFVAEAVVEKPNTTRIIDALVGRFPPGTRVIAGYLDDVAQFWKVNYHWEYLLAAIDSCSAADLSERHARCLAAIRSALLVNPPRPQAGYIDKGGRRSKIGEPADASAIDTIRARWRSLKQSKRDFEHVVRAAGIGEKLPKRRSSFTLAAAPIASPGTSKHGNGYALDIRGDNAAIKRISAKLGATLIFDEQFHVHVEFANGVKAHV